VFFQAFQCPGQVRLASSEDILLKLVIQVVSMYEAPGVFLKQSFVYDMLKNSGAGCTAKVRFSKSCFCSVYFPSQQKIFGN